eukprot:CAMPEP_0197030424 /NCGR_PEP_ID=MMETSP1384-20130603/9667_1 /TAXON_ID=29189 /ORGANISM="Ammonia sp." /LENGTH=661 /DNA_ID=CAMNT_0042459771 /DNA_START=33 /DNA_END=2018 /DNA_ORIENTATION=-
MPRKTNKLKNKRKQSKPGLGHGLMNKYGGKPERENQAQGRVKRNDMLIDQKFASPSNSTPSKQLVSVTEVSNLQEFVDMMQLQQQLREAAAEEDEAKLISNDPQESLETQEIEFHAALSKAETFNYENLPIPRKPKWDEKTTRQQLIEMEKESFLNWRRGLANTAKQSNLEMTPFEKNIEIWKQLWRVIERCNVLILIVDARNPLAFISRDLFVYVSEISQIRNEKKQCILMINKADYLTPLQRQYWRQYFDELQIKVVYFSAMREQLRLHLMTKSHRDKLSDEQTKTVIANIDGAANANANAATVNDVVSVDKLIDIFEDIRVQENLEHIEVGMIGYPNVGKSSIINVIIGSKRVSVGSTPGKTKHFQTLNLTKNVTLCDCPGLVFPTLMHSKADLVLNGVIPIDHLTDFITPARLMVHRLSLKQINECYHLKLPTNRKRARFITVYDVLDAFCVQRGLYNVGKMPDRTQAARVMLKDYVKGKMVYNHYPPSLNSRNRHLFYNGRLMMNNSNLMNEKLSNKSKNVVVDNVLDQNKLQQQGQMTMMAASVDENEEEEEEEEEEEDVEMEEVDEDGNVVGNDGMTDEEFLSLWKHTLDDGGPMGSSKSKHDKKVRVLRRIEKRQQKQNRKFRRDADNFAQGSNAVVVSAVPHIKAKNQAVLL